MSTEGLAARWVLPGSLLAAFVMTIVPLPASLEPFRPAWVALVMVYWALVRPASIGVGTGWLAGLMLDAMHGSLLGQHALALAVLVFLALKFRLRIRVYPIWQQAVTVMLMLAVYEFLLFWVDGVVGLETPGLEHWSPVPVSAVLWPPLTLALDLLLRQRKA